MKRVNELKIRMRKKKSLPDINRKRMYKKPSLYLLGNVIKKTAGNGDSNQFDLFAPNAPMS